MRQSMLTDEQAQFLREEKEALAEIRLALADIDVPREALTTLQEAILQLDELFLLVVVGEFNAGKSALVNALLGEKVLPEGATPTTSRVTLVKWGEQAAEQVVDERFSIYTYPLPLLKELNIVDTPGTNAVIRYHERLTDEFVPRSDLILFITSADHPLTESERQFLERIVAWGKKVVFALNKADIIEDEAALQEVRAFILKHATTVLGDTPDFFPVSARLAQRALSETDVEQRRRALHMEHIVGEGIEPREMRRRELIDTVGKTVQRIIETYDQDREARALAAHVETAVAQTALLEVGAVGLGALVTAAVLSSSLDVTGILAAGTLAVLGFFVIPYKRKQAKDNFKEKLTNLRTKLLDTLTTQFARESQNAVARLKDGVTPYIRYVRAERERIDRSETTLAKLRKRLSALRARSQVVVGK